MLLFWSSFASAKAPIVFVHGFGTPSVVYEKLVPLKKLMNENGYELYISKIPDRILLEEGSKFLADELEARFPDEPFHIVAHSMGGLHARKMISEYSIAKPSSFTYDDCDSASRECRSELGN